MYVQNNVQTRAYSFELFCLGTKRKENKMLAEYRCKGRRKEQGIF